MLGALQKRKAIGKLTRCSCQRKHLHLLGECNMPIKFPYRFIPGARGVTPRPVIPIQMGLTEESTTYGYIALIDSGADICLFPSFVAREIGIKDISTGMKSGVRGVVAGSNAEYYMHRVTV